MKIILAIIAIAILLCIYNFARLYRFTKKIDSHMTESCENER